MPKKLVVCVLLVLVALLVVIPVGSASAEGQVKAGPSWCYVVIDYFSVGLEFTTVPPYVRVIGPTGGLGAGVHCPWPPPIPPIGDLIDQLIGQN